MITGSADGGSDETKFCDRRSYSESVDSVAESNPLMLSYWIQNKWVNHVFVSENGQSQQIFG